MGRPLGRAALVKASEQSRIGVEARAVMSSDLKRLEEARAAWRDCLAVYFV
jgi:hypothetical protein